MVDRIVTFLVDQWKKQQAQHETENFQFDDDADALATLHRAVDYHEKKQEAE